MFRSARNDDEYARRQDQQISQISRTPRADSLSYVPSDSPSPPPTYPAYQPAKPTVNTYIYTGIACAIVAIFIVPEVFGSAAIILGAYAWRLECGESKNRGIWVIAIGIIAMLLGIYYTSLFGLYNILP